MRRLFAGAVLGVAAACGSETTLPSGAADTSSSAGTAPRGGGNGGTETPPGGHASGGAVSMNGSQPAMSGSGGALGGASGSSAVAGDANGGNNANGGSNANGGDACSGASTALSTWPGQNEVKTLDAKALFESDVSGLTYDAGTSALWAVNNASSKLYRLVPSGAGYVPDSTNGWTSGKPLLFPNGQGTPDAEGVTMGETSEDGVYVCSEHDASDSANVSRLSILRYDVSAAGASLTATHEWNLTALVPKAGYNTGFEAVTWVPDALLTAGKFLDEGKNKPYSPEDYADHGKGLFFAGVEETGRLYAFALNHQDGSAALVASVQTPNPGVMGLEFDRERGKLWFNCDDGCDNQSGVLALDPKQGRFVLQRQFERPTTLPNSNNEGIALGPCNAGFQSFFWADDADFDGFSLRQDSLPCGCR